MSERERERQNKHKNQTKQQNWVNKTKQNTTKQN
jgi:hypothetical protein